MFRLPKTYKEDKNMKNMKKSVKKPQVSLDQTGLEVNASEMFNDGKDVSEKLSAEVIERIQNCKDCKAIPHVTIAYAKNATVHPCKKHWTKIADSNAGWSGSI